MKVMKTVSRIFLSLGLFISLNPFVQAIVIIGSDGNAVSDGVDDSQIQAGTGEIVLYAALAFAAVVAISVALYAIALAMGKRQWVADNLLNLIGAILLFAFGASAVAGIIGAIS